MKVNQDYLKEFCEENNLFLTKYINHRGKNKIIYYFGVPEKRLNRIRDINQLEKRINKYGKSPSNFDIDLKIEAEELGKLYNKLLN